MPRGTDAFDEALIQGQIDPDALAYVRAVERADNAALCGCVKLAVHDFVAGCKMDGIWQSIKASCILAGARTLSGALVPLKGTAPTNFNFVAADYNRKTGLVGNGSTKYLDTNRNNNADPQNSKHLAAFVSTVGTGFGDSLLAVGSGTGRSILLTGGITTINRSTFFTGSAAVGPIFVGASRADSSNVTRRVNSVSTSYTSGPSEVPFNASLMVFNRPGANYSNHRIAFYSIGESLNLALLDARVTTLVRDIALGVN
jgi:hypothetical protein